MADRDEFRFISIEDDDDEVVIQAGIRSQDAPDDQDAVSGCDDLPGNPASDCGVAGNDVQACEEAAVGYPDEDEEAAAERRRHERERARRQAGVEANRMITTEEDLKAKAPFAGMRRAIIIVAVLLVVVAIVYIVS